MNPIMSPCNAGERYVYKFVCDPEALFQMALAENHRNALKAEAAAVLKGSAAAAAAAVGGNGGSSSSSGVVHADGQEVYGKPRHQFSDMLNQVWMI